MVRMAAMRKAMKVGKGPRGWNLEVIPSPVMIRTGMGNGDQAPMISHVIYASPPHDRDQNAFLKPTKHPHPPPPPDPMSRTDPGDGISTCPNAILAGFLYDWWQEARENNVRSASTFVIHSLSAHCLLTNAVSQVQACI